MKKVNNVFGVLRILMGWLFLWPFLDKVYGLGFATEAGKGWVDGNSPTFGFLKFGTKGPFVEVFQSMAGNLVVDWLFMIGLLLIGVAFILGIGMRVAGFAGALLLVLMYLAVIPPEHNPFVDDHIIYALLMIGLATGNSANYIGFGNKWSSTDLVKRFPFLR